jgi:tricorn protease
MEVRPIRNETDLRYLEWVETRRETVERLASGRLGYLHMPDTGYNGAAVFNREFPALLDREGLILDGRHNSGGEPADTVVEALARRPLSAYAFRAGADMPFPVAQVRGPKVMLIDEAAGSGGDTLPWMFRQAKIGPLVGRRTQGAGIGFWVSGPELVDSGTVQLPNRAFFDPHRGRWAIENAGVSPDVDVENLPADWRAGRDRQLERAVSIALSLLEKGRPLLRRPSTPEGTQR